MATLYRKYRSKTFDDVIGQDPIVTTLTNQIKLGRIGHAYLFTGSRGIGKTSCARIFARAVNCLHPVNGNPCGECEVCKRLAVDNVDIIEMDAASNNGVDDARDIREKVKYAPVACKYKVYIIDEVHMLTGGAFNALLKTIEEPPEHVIFILATTEPQKLPQTILSRCIRFDFRLVPTDILAKHIARIYDAEGIKYTADAVEEIARLGEGSVRDALSVADTLGSAADVITADVVLSLTGAGDKAAVARLFDRVAARDMPGMFDTVDALVKSGKSMSAVCRQLIEYTRNVLVCKSVGGEKAVSAGMINADKESVKSIRAAAEKYPMAEISRILTELGAAENGLKYSVSPRVFIETALVKLIGASDDSAGSPAEQKKNNQVTVASQPEQSFAPEPRPERPEQNQPPAPEQKSVTERARPRQSVDAAPPEYIPDEPPQQAYIADEPPVPAARETRVRGSSAFEAAKARAQPKSADEGEFWHLSAIAEDGLELQGKVVRTLRKSSDPAKQRVLRLLGRGVDVRERDGHIGFVAPDAVFLQMGDESVTSVLRAVLDGLDEHRPIEIERTADDLFYRDVARAKRMFTPDGVTADKPR